MDIKQMIYFKSIVDEGSISAAAKVLHIAQPALSNSLSTLEKELGIKLMTRGSRNITLNDAGLHLYEKASAILSLQASTVAELKSISTGRIGTIKLGSVSSSCAALLTNNICEFIINNRDIHFEIHEGNTYRLLQYIEDNIVDIAIVRSPFRIEPYNYIPLLEDKMAVVATQSYLESSVEKITMSDLANKPLIIYGRFLKLLNETFEKHKVCPTYICINEDARTSIQWASKGLGIAIVPYSIAKQNNNSEIIIKVIDEQSLETNVYAIWRKNSYLNPCTQRFIESLRNNKKD
ncbi:MAG: LysR family transcriptional regulator [Erysipelotrichaceae bacterium]